jgi:hypothetical protein
MLPTPRSVEVVIQVAAVRRGHRIQIQTLDWRVLASGSRLNGAKDAGGRMRDASACIYFYFGDNNINVSFRVA